jgi:rhamnose transport system substrate-binding protein
MKKIVSIVLMLALAAGIVFAGGQQAASGGGGIEVRLILSNKGNPYLDPIIAGVMDAVKAGGGVCKEVSPEVVDATQQIPLIEAAIQDKVDVILINPSSVDVLNASFDKARAAGIPVICVNDDIMGSESHRDGVVLACDYEQVGPDSFEQFAKAMNYAGKFVVLSAATESPFQNHQIELFREAMKDPKYKDLQLLEVLYGNDEPAKSMTETEAALQKYPDLKGIISPTTVGCTAAAQVIEGRGLQNKIVVTGLDTPTQAKSFLQNGSLKACMLWDTYREGKVAGYLAMQVAKGEYKIQPGTSFTAGEYGATKVLANGVIYAGPPANITAENVDTYKF